MKAFIITMSDKPTSVELAKKCRESVIHYCAAALEPIHFEAVQPKGILSATLSVFGEHVAYTYPESPFNSHMDFNTNLYLKAYETNDVKKIIACSLSHMKLWKFCVEENETIAVLEHDAIFHDWFGFDLSHVEANKDWGVLGLNCPRGNTRKGSIFASAVEGNGNLVQNVPEIDGPGEPPLPQGLAGNSAYLIRPHAAKALLDKTKKLGIWPNDAIMCKQLFPWLRVTYPFYTTTQRNVSSTTK